MSGKTIMEGGVSVPTLRYPFSSEAEQVVTMAWQEAARQAVPPTTLHLFLALYSSNNMAQQYLREQRVEPSQLGNLLDPRLQEAEEVLALVWNTALQLAQAETEPMVTSLHVLAGILRYHQASQVIRALRRAGHDTSRLRNLLINCLTQQRHRPAQTSTPALVEEAARAPHQRAAAHPPGTPENAWDRTPPKPPAQPPYPDAPHHEHPSSPSGPALGWTELEPDHPLNAPNPYLPPEPSPAPAPSTAQRSPQLRRPPWRPEGLRPAPQPGTPPPGTFAPPQPRAPRLFPTSSPPAPATTTPRPPRTPRTAPDPPSPKRPESLADRLKGRFGSRKTTRKPEELAPPHPRGLALNLFGRGGSVDALLARSLDRSTDDDRPSRRDQMKPPPPRADKPAPKPAKADKPAQTDKPAQPDKPATSPPTTPTREALNARLALPSPLSPVSPASPSSTFAPTPPAPAPAPAAAPEPPRRRSWTEAERQEQGLRCTLSEEQFPKLAQLGRNLSLMAFQGRIDPLVGRDGEIAQLLDVLNKRRNNNPMLVGPAGVGKTAIVEGLALRMIEQPEICGGVADRVIVELEMGRLLAGTQLRGSFSERLIAIKDEVRRAEGRVIIFLDEIHTWMGAGASGDGGADAAGELKAALARGEFPCIGATTEEEYKKFIESSPAFRRRFMVVDVSEPSREDTLTILHGALPAYSKHHDVAYDDAAVESSVYLSQRYITERRLPDKAFNLLDLAGSRARRMGHDRVDREIVARVVSDQTGIPVDKLLMRDRERFLRMDEVLRAGLIGHAPVVARLCQVIRRNYAGFQSGRPIGSFLFLGPTGVGKTELVKVLADFLFRDRNAIVRLDMSEYMESHAVSRMIGAPPGYVGYDQGGQLTEKVRSRPYQIVLLDEIEKAHPEVLNVLLQLLDDGRLTDGQGRTVDFSNTVIILTSNLGSEHFSERLRDVGRGRIGFGALPSSTPAEPSMDHDLEAAVITAARGRLSPELWNRIEERLVFGPLSRAEIARIARLQLRDSSRRLEAERDITLEATDAVFEHLIDHGGYDPQLGARPMRQTIQRLIESPIAELILQGDASAGQTVEVHVKAGTLAFKVR